MAERVELRLYLSVALRRYDGKGRGTSVFFRSMTERAKRRLFLSEALRKWPSDIVIAVEHDTVDIQVGFTKR